MVSSGQGETGLNQADKQVAHFFLFFFARGSVVVLVVVVVSTTWFSGDDQRAQDGNGCVLLPVHQQRALVCLQAGDSR